MAIPPYWAIVVTDRSLTASGAPAPDRILWAFTAAAPSQAGVGSWVGPAPKILRSAEGVFFVTTATWIWQWNDRAFADQAVYDSIAANFAQRLFANFRFVSSGFEPPNIGPYSPSLHGDLASWTNGTQAAASRTAFPDRNLVPSNPLGQIIEAPAVSLERAAGSIGRAALILGAVVVGGAALYYGAEYLYARPARESSTRRTPRRRDAA